MSTDDELSLESGVSEDSDARPPSFFSGIPKDDQTSTNDETKSENDPSVGDSVVGSEEKRMIQSSKACVFFVLALAAAGGAYFAYRFLRSEDLVSMEKQVSRLSLAILAS